jgi:type VI secretion system secreted protein VgrG
MNQTTGRRWIHNVGDSISLFVAGTKAKVKETFKLIAAKGNIQMQAQDGQMELTAQQDVTITSVNGKVVIQAPKEILLTASGGYIRIGADIEIHNPGTQSQKAAGFSLTGPASQNPIPPALPQAAPKPAELLIQYAYHDDGAVHGAKFTAQLADGSIRTGFTDAAGMARLTDAPPGAIRIRFGPDARPYEIVEPPPNPDQKPDLVESDLDALYAKHGGQS